MAVLGKLRNWTGEQFQKDFKSTWGKKNNYIFCMKSEMLMIISVTFLKREIKPMVNNDIKMK